MRTAPGFARGFFLLGVIAGQTEPLRGRGGPSRACGRAPAGRSRIAARPRARARAYPAPRRSGDSVPGGARARCERRRLVDRAGIPPAGHRAPRRGDRGSPARRGDRSQIDRRPEQSRQRPAGRAPSRGGGHRAHRRGRARPGAQGNRDEPRAPRCAISAAFEEAVERLEHAVRLHPQDALLRGSLGVALIKAGRNEAALDALDAAVRLDPENAATLGRLLGERGQACDWAGVAEPARAPSRSCAQGSRRYIPSFCCGSTRHLRTSAPRRISGSRASDVRFRSVSRRRAPGPTIASASAISRPIFTSTPPPTCSPR